MPYSGSSGNYGSIAESTIREKYEITNEYFDPETLNDYMRTTLKDTRPDATFFESDHARRDNHSGERLSLRFTGHRTGAVPYHPDAFLELTERDPRGTAEGPNFRKSYEQSLARMKYVNFYSDADPKTTERERTPAELQRNMSDAFYSSKDRMKWFETSKGNIAAARNFRRRMGDSLMQDVDTDGNDTMMDRPDARQEEAVRRNFNSYTTKLSNNHSMGWHKTTDHEFKVAKYGAQRKIKNPAHDHITKLLHQSHVDHGDKLTTFQDQVVSSGLAQVMRKAAEEQKIRYTYQDQDFAMDNQKMPSQYRKLYGDYGNQRKKEAIVEELKILKLKDTIASYMGPRANHNVVNQRKQTNRTNKLAEMMESGTQIRDLGDIGVTNYRKNMQEQVTDERKNKDYDATNNIPGKTQKIESLYAARRSKGTAEWKKDKMTKLYSSNKKSSMMDTTSQSKNYNTEKYKKESFERGSHTMGKAYRKPSDEYTATTTDYADNFALPQGTGRAGSKRARGNAMGLMSKDMNSSSNINEL